MQLISQECFAPEASNLVSRYNVVLDDYMTPIGIQVSRSNVSIECQVYSLYVAEGGISVLRTSIFFCMNYERNTLATNFEAQECVICVQSTKICTHENKAIHSK